MYNVSTLCWGVEVFPGQVTSRFPRWFYWLCNLFLLWCHSSLSLSTVGGTSPGFALQVWMKVCLCVACVCVCVRRTLYLNVWAVMSWHQKQVCNMYTDYANARTLSPVRSCSLSNIKLHHGKFPFTSTIFLFSERVTPSSHSHLSSTWKIVVSCCKMDSSWGWDCFVDHLFFYLPFRSGVTTF